MNKKALIVIAVCVVLFGGCIFGLVARSRHNERVAADLSTYHTSMTVQEIKERIPEQTKASAIVQTTHYKEYDYEDDNYEYTDYQYEKYCYIYPDPKKTASVSIVSSGIEDGMIYTLTNQVDEDGHMFEILYINEPYTRELIAMGVRADFTKPSEKYRCETDRVNYYKLYTFLDENGYSWYDKHPITEGEEDDF